MCRRKKNKIKEIKRCLREKSELVKFYEKGREREKGGMVQSSITADLSPYRIFEIRARVTSSGRISLITRQENTSTFRAKVISDFA